jgi:hypothetical protein
MQSMMERTTVDDCALMLLIEGEGQALLADAMHNNTEITL